VSQLHLQVNRTRNPLEPPAIRASSLGKRYGSRWALRDCTLEIPARSVTALVGPNGAGKTTLLQMVIGLVEPTSGGVEVFGHSPKREAKQVLPQVGFVAQDHPLHRNLTITEMLDYGRKLNPSWNQETANVRIEHLGLSAKQKIGQLSGGQQAQVALTMALAKQPRLLLLDEPVASLDPLARREFLNAVTDAAANDGITVVLSSHIVAELERVCDHLVTITGGETQLAGPIAEILASHRLLTGSRSDASAAQVPNVVRENHTARETMLLVRDNGPIHNNCWSQRELSLEEIVLAYLDPAASTGRTISAGEEAQS
jgi:ABC-2 type transport system ATP-binding protein